MLDSVFKVKQRPIALQLVMHAVCYKGNAFLNLIHVRYL